MFKRLYSSVVSVVVALFGVSLVLSAANPSLVYAAPELPNSDSSQTANPETNTPESTESSGETCWSTFGMVSWIVCPVTGVTGLAVDALYGMMGSLLVVDPLIGNQTSAIYLVWSYMRDIANVVFVIFILVVVYSQVTSVGISNYGIKKTLPRIIIAAIMVNLSFYISAIAVDLSNILGDQLRQVFEVLKDQAVAAGAVDVNIGWGDLTAAIMGTGGLLAAGVVGVAAAGGGVGVMFLLVPAVLSAVLAIIAAIVTLAARQAIIILLVLISPLAFVAYLLPNTERWFDKWRKLGMTLLIMYPAISVLIGASQLAGWAIMASADNMIQIVLGLAVQVIPLALTPVIAKTSGSMLGGIQSAINRSKPMQGMRGGVKDWSKTRQDTAKARMHAGVTRKGTPRRHTPVTAAGNWMAYRKYNADRKKETAEASAKSTMSSRYERANHEYETVNGVEQVKALTRQGAHEQKRRVLEADNKQILAASNNNFSNIGEVYKNAAATGTSLSGRGRADSRSVIETANQMGEIYRRTEMEKSLTQNNDQGDRSDYANYINKTFADHYAHEKAKRKLAEAIANGENTDGIVIPPDSPNWEYIVRAAGSRGEEGIQTIRATAAAAKDIEDQRILKERETQMAKQYANTPRQLEDALRQAYKDRDVFGMRAAINLLATKGSFGISSIEKVSADMHANAAEYGVDVNDKEWRNLHGVWSAHIAGMDKMREKAVGMWYYASQMTGKDDYGNYTMVHPDTGEPITDNFSDHYYLFNPEVPDPRLKDNFRDAAEKILTGPGSLTKLSTRAMKDLFNSGVVSRSIAERELNAAARDPQYYDSDPEKLTMLGVAAGWIDNPDILRHIVDTDDTGNHKLKRNASDDIIKQVAETITGLIETHRNSTPSS